MFWQIGKVACRSRLRGAGRARRAPTQRHRAECLPLAPAECARGHPAALRVAGRLQLRELLLFAALQRHHVGSGRRVLAWDLPLRGPTKVMRLAAVDVRCNWPGCTERRFPQARHGTGRSWGMYRHLNLHAAEAGAAAHLLHAANACGLCGSSAAGCVVNSVVHGKEKPVVLCNTPPMCHKTPSLTPPKAGKLKSVPVKCGQCDAWVWGFALRSHCALRHADKELPPALSEDAIKTLKAADRVKLVRPAAALGLRKRKRAEQSSR